MEVETGATMADKKVALMAVSTALKKAAMLAGETVERTVVSWAVQ